MNNKIEPRYVDFNTSRLLKEKGLVANCKRYWVKYSNTEYKEMSDIQLEDLDREIGIGGNLVIPKYEQWQVVKWLRVNHGIWITLYPYDEFREDLFLYLIVKRNGNIKDKYPYNSPQEAYSAAINHILNEL